MPTQLKPEQSARQEIDAKLAEAGWVVQNRDEANLSAGRGVAIREFKMADSYGFADYLMYVDKKAVGALEAKPVGFTLSGVKPQVDKYSKGLPANLPAPIRPLPFLYVSTGVETNFVNLLDPQPRSRRVFSFHRPETNGCRRITYPIGSADGAVNHPPSMRPTRSFHRRCVLAFA